jgi:hypothetical protein
MGNHECSNELHEKLSSEKPAGAKLAVAFHILREGYRTGTAEEAIQRARGLLDEVLAVTLEPGDFTAAFAVLYNLVKQTDNIDVLEQTCTSVPLALGVMTRALIEHGDLARAKLAFQNFLYEAKSEMSLQDKAVTFLVFINFLRRGGGTIADVREAEKALLEIERKLRAKMLSERREITKDTTGMNEIMSRWITYLQESEAMRGDQI